MQKFIAICLLMTNIATMYSMEQEAEVSHLGHPCLPREFYQGNYSKLLEDSSQKEALITFAKQRLQTLLKAHHDGTQVEDRGDFAAAVFGLYHTDSIKKNGAVQGYGKIVASISMRAFRKALGVTMGIGDVNEHEKWELRKVAPDEFMQLFKEKYTEDDFRKVELIEQIHAHKMLLDLAQNK